MVLRKVIISTKNMDFKKQKKTKKNKKKQKNKTKNILEDGEKKFEIFIHFFFT